MNNFSFLKKTLPFMVVFALVLGALNFGSYDPYNEIKSLVPEVAQATFSVGSLTVPTLSVPTLSNSPSLTTPSISTPVLTAPVLTTPSLTVPNLTVPDLTVPNLTTPNLAVPNLTVPNLGNVPDLTIPNLGNVPDLTIPNLGNVPVLTVPNLGNVPDLTIPDLTIPVLNGTSTGNSIQSCHITSNLSSVTTGASVTITWTTQGFSNVTLNGVALTSLNGSKTFTNVQANTTYTLVAKTADGQSKCETNVVIQCVPPVVAPTCETLGYDFTVAKFTWNGSMYVKDSGLSNYVVTLAGNDVQANWTSNKVIAAVIGQTAYSYGVFTGGLNGTLSKCDIGSGCDKITHVQMCANTPVVTPAPTCALTPASQTINKGESVNLNWSSTNGASATLSDFGTVALSGTKNTGALNSNKTYTLTVKGTDGQTVNCSSVIKIKDVVVEHPFPVCNSFAATPGTINLGESSVLKWVTTDATSIAIDNGIGIVTATGTMSVKPLSDIVYTLTAYGVNNKQVTCQATLKVKTPVVIESPKCEAFTATPSSLPVGGGSVKLVWSTSNASTTTINPTVGNVANSGSTTVTIANTQTFTLVTSNSKSSDSCTVTVPVAPVVAAPITCEKNVTVGVSPTSITSGNSSTLTWSTVGITGVSFDNGITATGLSGSVTTSPTATTVYNLTATDGKNIISCPVTLNVTTVSTGGGGGGGGSSTPRCELSVSKNKISRGEEITLTWDSRLASDVYIENKTENIKLLTTDGLKSSEKKRLFDGSMRLTPKVDTTYKFTVERGSRTRTCTVDVDVVDNVVVTQIRDQQPLVAGISLTQVPYTGFEAGPILTLMFYTLLMAWALYMAYLLVIRRDVIGGMKLATVNSQPTRLTPEQIRPDVFVANVQAPVMPISNLPSNLPTGTPVIGYGNSQSTEAKSVVSSNVHNVNDEEMTRIENHAHAQRVLLSSDAIRHFVATTNNETERANALDQVIVAAKSQFPAEDGWVVLNEKRMQDLCLVCAVNETSSSKAPYIPAVVAEGSGSLAEAIVIGNVVSAYEMIGNRPMFALADAAADLDAVYRIRRGGEGAASELLMKETATLTNEQILQMISALTGALDGTYTDEAAAVKMSIMKAIKVVA